jgi:hypothetical protein
LTVLIDLVQISKDDLIGCASLPFTDLTEGHFEGWKNILVPSTSSKTSRISNLSDLKRPELKLKVKMSFTGKPIDCCEFAGMAADVVVPLARLNNRSRIEAELLDDLGIA